MINIKITLVYLIIHLLCVLHIFDVFKYSNYKPTDTDKITVWLIAPEILLVIWVCMFLRKGR